MPSKALRKPAGTADRRGAHRARLPLPTPGASVTEATRLTSSHRSAVIHDSRLEDQSFRTSVSYPESEAVTDCAFQLRKIGDKLNLRQRILNLIAKLFCPGTQACLE